MKLFQTMLVILGCVFAAVIATWMIESIVSGSWGLHRPTLQISILSATAAALTALIFLQSPLRTSKISVVPPHFESALNGLNEGVVILDYSGRIVFCNQTFLNCHQFSNAELVGKKARDLNWKWADLDTKGDLPEQLNWIDAIREDGSRSGRLIGTYQDSNRVFKLQAVPISLQNQRPLGAMICFEEITKLQKKQAELSSMLETIRQSSQQIRQLSSELEQLAVRDTLSGCLNRRQGLDFLNRYLAESKRDRSQLTCILADIDHFRRINDIFGHDVADDVLRETGRCLMQYVRNTDIVSRHDGEAFLIIMPRTSLEEGVRIAEVLRREVARLQVGDANLTISIGVAELTSELEGNQGLLQEARRRLDYAKQNGRNQICWQDLFQSAGSASEAESQQSDVSRTIPYPAVTALMSALAYRDLATASHSRRVADLCVAVGQRQMSMSGCYVLEMSALLHDIGKIGVPDDMLLKASPLSEAEWKVLRTHDRIGVEIVRTAFGTPELTEIVENYMRPYGEAQQDGFVLPLGSRILAVADAFDSMTSPQIYRKALTTAEALAELLRCSGTQFDPEIVSQFVEIMKHRGRETSPTLEVNVETALAFGMELERLAEAVDQQDLAALRSIAGYLCRTASRSGAHEITAKAIELEQATSTGTDLLGVLRMANELLNYCRSTQRMYIIPGDSYARPAFHPVLDAPAEESAVSENA